MIINQQNLDALFIAWNGIFQKSFMAPTKIYYDRLATVVPSDTSENMYPFLGLTLGFREWLGDRVIQNLEAHGYTLRNRDFEDTVGVNRNQIEDDRYGVYNTVFEQLGWNARRHPDKLLFSLIKASTTTPNSVLAYDGTAFFGSHTVGKAGRGSGTSFSNIDSGGTGPYWYLLDVSRPIKGFILQKRKEYTFVRMNVEQDEKVFMAKLFRYGVDARINVGVGLWQLAYASNQDLTNSANFANALAAMRSVKTDAGEPFESALLEGPDNLVLLVPPSLQDAAYRLQHAELVAGGAGGPSGAAGPVSNIYKGTADVVVSPWLA
jgi:phage major head subunit gpT-like protein